MTVNLVPQLAIQRNTTLRDLENMFHPDKHPQRAGLTLAYHQVIDDTTFLTGELVVRGNPNGDAFHRGGVVRTGPYWHYFADQEWRMFSDEVDTRLDLPERGQALRAPLLEQRKALETLVPRLYELHDVRSERIKSQPEYTGYPPNVRHAIGDLPAVDYLEALGLLGKATFTLLPGFMGRMAYSNRVKTMTSETPVAPATGPRKLEAAVFVDGVRQDGGY